MSHAFVSASLAADALTSILKREVAVEAAFERYRREREAAVRPLRGFTRLTFLSLVKFGKNPLSSMLIRTPLAKGIGGAVHAASPASSLTGIISKALIQAVGV